MCSAYFEPADGNKASMVSAKAGAGPAKAINNTAAAAEVTTLTRYIPVIPFIFTGSQA